MCDYSLQAVESQAAKVGDRLISTSFPNAVTRGFAAVDKPEVAVCLLPGSEVAFDEDVIYYKVFPFWPRRRAPHRVARFRQIDTECATAHHDALEFPDGKMVLLQALKEGQHLTVLQLPASQRQEFGVPALSRAEQVPEVIS